ncbi:MAG: PD-(D/E)XK nuclease family transposase [Clostridia bacterium]|nr:PD-(D/E)XK nuclease family transposase [Clostridia bacterium]
MAFQTSIAKTLDNAGDEAKLDRNVKKIFSHEAILAPLMRMCIPEFQGFSDEFIATNCFVEKPEVSKYTVHQDEGGKPDGNQRITQMNSEDNAANEQVIHYDIRFTARVPETDRDIKVIINLEIQVDDGLHYQVVTRGLYYCSRMISAQYGTVFTHSEYEKLQKVYSIWICPGSRTRQNAITDYMVQEKPRIGNNTCEKANYDKLQVIVVTLGQDGTNSTDQLIKYLSLILSDEKPLDERKRQLEDEYRIPMTYEIEEEMSGVCNMGEAIRRKAEAEGRIEGRVEGESRLGALMAKLFSLNRMDDARRCTTDVEFREKLYKEFQLA